MCDVRENSQTNCVSSRGIVTMFSLERTLTGPNMPIILKSSADHSLVDPIDHSNHKDLKPLSTAVYHIVHMQDTRNITLVKNSCTIY